MGSTFSVLTMKVLVVLSAALACALGAPKVSLKAISTPMGRGGGRIVGGSDAYHGEFPHQIALLRGGVGGSLMCGGSLVAEDRVITAGHCCDGQSASRLGVRVGSQNLYDEDEDQADIAVSKVILHESYDDWTISNDICILELADSADLPAPTSAPSPCPAQEKSTLMAPCAPLLVGEPPAREAASAESSRRWMSPLSLTMTAVTPMAPALSTTPRSALGSPREARTPAKETLAAPSCVEASSLVLYPGGTAVPRLDTPESTLRLLTSLTGLATICKLLISNSQALILYRFAHF